MSNYCNHYCSAGQWMERSARDPVRLLSSIHKERYSDLTIHKPRQNCQKSNICSKRLRLRQDLTCFTISRPPSFSESNWARDLPYRSRPSTASYCCLEDTRHTSMSKENCMLRPLCLARSMYPYEICHLHPFCYVPTLPYPFGRVQHQLFACDCNERILLFTPFTCSSIPVPQTFSIPPL